MVARRRSTYAVRFTSEDGKVVKAEMVDIGKEGQKTGKKIETGFNRSGRATQGFSDRVRQARAGMAALAGVAATLVGTAVFGRLIDQSIDYAEAIGKAADRTGFGTDKLQEWRVVANLAGIETTRFDKGLTRFTRAIGEAAQGTGEGLRVFQQLGIAVVDVTGKTRSSEAVFEDIRRKIEEFDNQADAAAAASLVFGERLGPALAAAIRKGSDAIDGQIERARELGLVLDEDLIRRSEEARDQIDLLTAAIGVNFRAAILETLPVVQDIVAGITDIFIASRGGPSGFAFGDDLERIRLEAAILREELADLEGQGGGRATAERGRLRASLAIRERRDAFLQEQKILEQIAEQESKIANVREVRGIGSRGQQSLRDKEIKELERLEEQLIAVRIAIEEAAAPPPAAAPPAVNQAGVTIPTPKARPDAETFLRNARDELKAILDATDASIAGFAAQGEAIKQAQALQAQFGARGKAVFDGTRTAAEQYEAELADLNVLLKANAIDTETFERASLQAWRTSLEGSREFKDGAAQALIEFGEEATNAADLARKGVTGAFEGMEDAIAQFAATGKIEIAGLVNAAIADFTRLALRTAVFGPLANAFAGVFAPTPTPATGSAGSGVVQVPLAHGGGVPGQDRLPSRAVAAAAFRQAPHFRLGGIVGGERAAVLHDGEGVFTPAQMRALGPASAPNVTIINQASDQVRVEAQRGGNPQDLLLFIKRELATDIATGGMIGREIGQSFNTTRRTGSRG